FTPENLTGAWLHPSFWSFLIYLLDLLGGQKGFFGCNLVLYVALAGLPRLLRRQLPERAELACAAVWFIGIVLIYSATSNNYPAVCPWVRWFVPLPARGFLFLAVLLRDFPESRREVWIVGAWSLLWSLPCWWVGPWERPPLLLYWLVMFPGVLFITLR